MEEEIKIGEYVRTELGIIYKYTEDEKNDLQIRDFRLCNNGKIVKHSKKLIELIKVGDYVNSYKVRGKTKEKIVVDYYCYSKELADGNWLSFNNEMIKTILTKESYEDNSYKVGGEDE